MRVLNLEGLLRIAKIERKTESKRSAKMMRVLKERKTKLIVLSSRFHRR